MAIRKIITLGDETLRKKSKEVTVINKHLLTLLDDMVQTLRDSQGVGLAAPQVGVLRRVFVADCGDGLVTFINPVITATDGEQTGPEGCLSIPDRSGDTVTRPMYVTVDAVNRDGKPFTMKVSGLMARCVCHETDQLDGVLYIDKVDKTDTETK